MTPGSWRRRKRAGRWRGWRISRTADHQHLHAGLDCCQGLALDTREGVRRAVDTDHLRHRQAGNENPVQAGGDELIALAHIGVGKHEAHLQAALAATEEHTAHTVTQHGHRNRLVAVGEQRDLGLHRMHTRDLADDALRIDHRQPRLDALLCATVKDDLAREGIRRVVKDVGGDALDLNPSRHVEQLAQALVFELEQLEAQQALARAELLTTQVGVLALHLDQGGEVVRGIEHEIGRRGGRHLHRIGHDRERITHHFQVAEAQVGHQQHEADGDEGEQARRGRGAALEDRGRLMADERHPGNQGPSGGRQGRKHAPPRGAGTADHS